MSDERLHDELLLCLLGRGGGGGGTAAADNHKQAYTLGLKLVVLGYKDTFQAQGESQSSEICKNKGAGAVTGPVRSSRVHLSSDATSAAGMSYTWTTIIHWTISAEIIRMSDRTVAPVYICHIAESHQAGLKETAKNHVGQFLAGTSDSSPARLCLINT